ncbi:MAG: ThiF family adenylyltransferase [Nitrososphaerales archaeon]
MAKVEFVIPSVLNKGEGEKKVSVDADTLQDAIHAITSIFGEDFSRRVLDSNGKPRSLVNIYINGKNMRFTGGMTTSLKDGDQVIILPAVAGGVDLDNKELERYSRQIMLEDIGYEGQLKLRETKFCVVGIGGLGTVIASQLAAMGVGTLRIVDRDVIEISNLHRQTLFNDSDIGKVKVEVAAKRLKQMNPNVNVEPLPVSITDFTASKVVEGCGVVIDGLDSVNARYALNDACLKLGIPYVYGGAIGLLGSACTIVPNQTACLRCIFPNLDDKEMPTCSTEGIHPSVLSVISGVEVSEALKIITGQQPRLTNKLLYFDLKDLSFDLIDIQRHKDCASCGNAKKEVATVRDKLLVEELCGRDMGKRTFSITPVDLRNFDVNAIQRLAERNGFNVETRGDMGITVNRDGKLSLSLLKSGAAVIVGAKDEKDALCIYREFVKL